MNVSISFPGLEEKLAEISAQIKRLADQAADRGIILDDAKQLADTLKQTIDSLQNDVTDSQPK